jgi:RHS repeat-associated protein
MERFFDAFGNAAYENFINAEGVGVNRGDAGATSIAFAFTGRLFDATTGLQNNLHRWYDPTVGRWLSEDPIGFAGGDANLYRYVGNSPSWISDPSGENPIIIGIAIGWFIGAAFGSANVANAPAPGDHPKPDTGPGGGEPENAVIGGLIGGIAGAGATAAAGIAARGGAEVPKAQLASIMIPFFKGARIAKSPRTIAALTQYQRVAEAALRRYRESGYDGPGIQTQLDRLQKIQQQLIDWEVR